MVNGKTTVELRKDNLHMQLDGTSYTIPWRAGSGHAVVCSLAKKHCGDEVARLVQHFEDAGLPPTGVSIVDENDANQ